MKKPTAHFPKIKPIAYEGPGSANALAFRHYNPAELVDGKTMEQHMRFSVAYWHAFRGTGSDPFGPGTIVRPWEKGKDAVSVAKVRMDAAFEFFQNPRAVLLFPRPRHRPRGRHARPVQQKSRRHRRPREVPPKGHRR